jgi:hypothetical protein
MPEDMGFSTVLNTTVMNLCDGGDHEGKICQAYTQFPNGYIFEQFAAGVCQSVPDTRPRADISCSRCALSYSFAPFI